MDYFENIIGYVAAEVVRKSKDALIEFCRENEIGYWDDEKFVELVDLTDFIDVYPLVLEEIADAAMHYGDAYEILSESGWLTGWNKLTDYIGGGNWYNISQVAEAALWYEFNADNECMDALKEAVFRKIENEVE